MALDRDQVISRLAEGNGAADLSGLDLSGADLSRLDLRGVNLSRADLSSADLRWAILEGADLHSTVLRRADARWAVMRGANLRQADLARANLGWADISGADLTGAEMDGTNLDNVVLAEAVIERRVASRDWVLGRAPGGIAMPRMAALPLPRLSPVTLAAGAVGIVVLVAVWGWLYLRSYFGAFGIAGAEGVVGIGDLDNLTSGLLDVCLLIVKVLLASPLIATVVALIVGVLVAIALLLVRVAERILGDVVRPQVRVVVLLALFVFYTVAFFLLSPAILDLLQRLTTSGGPEVGGLAAIGTLARIGPWYYQLGLALVALAAAVAFWVGFRWLAHWLAGYELPTRARLRYPAMQSGLVAARESRLFRRSEPLTAEERRRGLLALVGGILLLGTVLTGTGRVLALSDMCDGGDLQRVRLYVNRLPAAEPDPATVCQRLLRRTEDRFYVFHPSQTTQDDGIDSREAAVSEVEASGVVKWYTYPPGGAECRTCAEGPAGIEWVVIDPDEVEVSGTITDHTGDILLLNVPADSVGTVRILPTTVVSGATGEPMSAGDLTVGVTIRALGRLGADGGILEARQIVTMPKEATPPAEIAVDLSAAPIVTVSGKNWAPASEVRIGLANVGQTAPQIGLASVVVQPDGTFNSPIVIPPDVPTGPLWAVVARGPDTGQSASGTWLQEPLPTPTPTPTRVVPTSPVETTPLPGQTPPGGATTPAGQGTGTPPAGTPPVMATNTPLARPSGSAPGGGFTCQPDEYEQDYPRPYAKEIFVGFTGDAAPTKRNFCPRGDIDLMWFRVKKARWYRVFTRNLAPGVDTVMAVGDLDNSTPCFPAGCWNDDRAALTYESEIVFQAVEDDRAMITVDNWGTFSDNATYELGVVEFEPTPTPTPTLGPSATPTLTPTSTRTPLPYVDRCEPNDTCRVSGDKCRIYPGGQAIIATIHPGTDEDYFESAVPLCAGATFVLTMIPPKGMDYDVEILNPIDKTRNQCPIADPSLVGYTPGDAVETLGPFAGNGLYIVVRVFTPYPSVYGSAYAPYRLILATDGRCSATSTATPTASLTPTRTATPTPSPSSTIGPAATDTSTAPPSETPTPTPSPPPSGTPTSLAGAAAAPPPERRR